VFTSSSSPGISLMSEGLSFIAGAQLPVVFVNIMRGGPVWAGSCPPRAITFRPPRAAGTGITACW
jgi:2-oxoglutarate ferredoxin oxidoreductase subunit alpha